MKKSIVFSIALIFMLSGCSFSSVYYQTGSGGMDPVSADQVKIYVGDINEEYTVIGSIAVNTLGKGKTTVQTLKEKAGKIGADAVIFVQASKISTYTQRTGLSGVAVRTKKL